MGYDTTFEGAFHLDRLLTSEHKSILDQLSQEEHTPEEDGKPEKDAESGRPCRYCPWRPSDDGSMIEWDMGEKFYCWREWLGYIVEHHLKPWGYRLNGEVRWQGEEPGDSGVIYSKDNRIEAVSDFNPGPSWGKRD